MKFNQLKIWQILPSNSLGFALSENFAHEDEINRLFTKLEYFDDETKKEDLAANAASIIDQSNSLINRHTLATESQWSTVAIAALKTVQMQVFLRLENSERIKEEYDSFIRATASTLDIVYQLNEADQKRFTSPFTETARHANKYLVPAVRLKPDAAPQEISVPDILAAATFVSDQNYNLGEVRSVFHQLWKIDELQPLLLYSAYATLGYRCDFNNEVTQSQPLQIVLVNDKITRNNRSNYTGFCSGSNMVVISTKADYGTYEVFNERIGATLAHELHHYFEESFHQSNQLLPYRNAATSFFSDPNAAIKSQLDKMVKEAISCAQKKEIEVPNSIVGGRLDKIFQPAETFGRIATYTGAALSQRIRHAEIVVRVSEIVADLCGTKKYSSAETFEKLQNFGLTECVDFFYREQQQMLQSCATIQRVSGINFNHKNPPAKNIADYIEYSPAPSQDALARDSLNQTNLELAMQHGNHADVLKFCREIYQESRDWKKLGSDIKLLHKTAFYLAELSYSKDEKLSKAAIELFELAKIMPYSFNQRQINNVFCDASLNNLDPALLEKISTTPDILSAIANKELPRFDILKNDLRSYIVKSKTTESKQDDILNTFNEKYDCVTNQTVNYFLPKNPLRKPLLYCNPEKFLEIFDAAINSEKHEGQKELGQKLLKDRMSIISLHNDSVIELVAHNCNDDFNGKKWYEIFKTLVRTYDIDVLHKSENNNQSLSDLLLSDIRADFLQNFYKKPNPNTTISSAQAAEKGRTDCCTIS